MLTPAIRAAADRAFDEHYEKVRRTLAAIAAATPPGADEYTTDVRVGADVPGAFPGLYRRVRAAGMLVYERVE